MLGLFLALAWCTGALIGAAVARLVTGKLRRETEKLRRKAEELIEERGRP